MLRYSNICLFLALRFSSNELLARYYANIIISGPEFATLSCYTSSKMDPSRWIFTNYSHSQGITCWLVQIINFPIKIFVFKLKYSRRQQTNSWGPWGAETERGRESGFSVVRILEAVYHVGERTELPKVPNSSPIKLTSRLAKYLSRLVRQLHTLRGGDESLVWRDSPSATGSLKEIPQTCRLVIAALFVAGAGGPGDWLDYK